MPNQIKYEKLQRIKEISRECGPWHSRNLICANDRTTVACALDKNFGFLSALCYHRVTSLQYHHIYSIKKRKKIDKEKYITTYY